MRETVDDKALRLLSTGKVKVACRSGQLSALVQGDHGVYAISSTGGRPLECTCAAAEHGKACSHRLAVELVAVAS